VLREELKRQNMRVSRLHAKLFYQPLLESIGSGVGLADGMSTEAAERQLAALGYQAPQNALTHLAALTGSTGRRGRVQSVLLPTLLDWLSARPCPISGGSCLRSATRALSPSA
jgi:glutamate-ammonia-ligase adenylyltransferase